MQETTDWCWRSGLVPVASSLGWAPIAAHLAERFGFHSYAGPWRHAPAVSPAAPALRRRTWTNGRSRPGAPTNSASPSPPAPPFAACPADGPLLDAVGVGIAFNAPDDVRALASTAVEGDDLRTVIPALEGLTAGAR